MPDGQATRGNVLRLISLIALMTLAGCSGRSEPAPSPPLVRVAIVRPGPDSDAQFTGVIRARIESDLSFRVPGKLVARLVEPGQPVKRGQALARIDASDYVLSVSAARDQMAAAEAESRQSDADLKRVEPLAAKGFVSGRSLDAARAEAQAAQARLRVAQANTRTALNQNAYTTLFADADGVVMSVAAEPGQVVSAGQPVVRLARAGPREAVVAIPENARSNAAAAATASLYGGDKEIAARLRTLAAAADPATRTYEARYVLNGDGSALPLGGTVTIRLRGGHANQLVVPLGAIYDRGQGSGVWMISGDPSQVHFRPVKIAAIREEYAVIESGLAGGERIVALGAHLLKDGQTVRTTKGAPAK